MTTIKKYFTTVQDAFPIVVLIWGAKVICIDPDIGILLEYIVKEYVDIELTVSGETLLIVLKYPQMVSFDMIHKKSKCLKSLFNFIIIKIFFKSIYKLFFKWKII